MFGSNGSQQPPGSEAGTGYIEPPSTGGLWGDMFGLGPLFKMMTDPALGAHAHGMMQAIIDGAQASNRIELKLNALLGALGHDVAEIERREMASAAAAAGRGPVVTALLAASGAAGNRSPAAASQSVDDGSGGAAASVGATGGGPRTGVADGDAAGGDGT